MSAPAAGRLRRHVIADLHLLLVASVISAIGFALVAIVVPVVPAALAPVVGCALVLPSLRALVRLVVGWLRDENLSASAWWTDCVRATPSQFIRTVPLAAGMAIVGLALTTHGAAAQLAIGPAVGATLLALIFTGADLVVRCLPAGERPSTWAVAARRAPAVLGSLVLGAVVTSTALATFPALMLWTAPVVAASLAWGVLRGLIPTPSCSLSKEPS